MLDDDDDATIAMAAENSLFFALIILIVAVLVLLVVFLVCRAIVAYFRRRRSSSSSSDTKADDLERPLFSENVDNAASQNYDLAGNLLVESRIQIDERVTNPRMQEIISGKLLQVVKSRGIQGKSSRVDVSTDASEEFENGQIVKHSLASSQAEKDAEYIRRDSINAVKAISGNGRSFVSDIKDTSVTGSNLTLEVIAGSSRGLCCSWQSTDTSILPVTLGRISPSNFLVTDSEVSGKHALINWNLSKLRWELVDMGSLNGTFLNSKPVQHPNSGSRLWSEPVVLVDGDIITLGASSQISVKISRITESQIPVGIGMASDSMSVRRGGKRLPMEDMTFCQCPILGVDQFGLFGICDGHGGAGAAKAASKLLPDHVVEILSHPGRKARVLSHTDASDILQDAFCRTEAAMSHQYEGCTATMLLIWFDDKKELFAQCANVGDSACIINANGKLLTMTEDHRVTSPSERARLMKLGKPLGDGESRLCGLNLCRMLGDKFLKEQDDRFSSKPYISQVVHIERANTACALMASDGLWDVISLKKAMQLVDQLKKKCNTSKENSAETIANYVLNEARSLRTKDNTSVIFLDFDSLRPNLVSLRL